MKLIEGAFAGAVSWCAENMPGEVFVFELQYVPADETFRELDRFLWESRHDTGSRFRNRYAGSVAVDVSAWNREHANRYFEAFLCYLKDHEDELDCCLFSEYEFSGPVLACVGKLFGCAEPVRVGELRSRRRQAVIGFGSGEEPRSGGIAARAGEDM